MFDLKLASGNSMPAMGLGTWRMGEQPDQFNDEVNAIRGALDLGVRMIDCAEMYGDGGAEEVIGSAISGQREKIYLISKVYPHNASRDGVVAACERSLARLNCDYLDLYLLHWPGNYPLQQTFEGFHALRDSGKIRDFGVSNFDLADLQEIPAEDQAQLGCNQVFYNLAHREVEYAVSDWCRQTATPLMAYSPLDQAGSMLQSPLLAEIANRHQASVAQIALAWLLHQPNTAVIPKSASPQRIQENLAATEISLSAQDLADLDQAFPAPRGSTRISMR